MSESTIVLSRAMIRVYEIPPNAEAIQAARDMLVEIRHGGGEDSARRIEDLAEDLAYLLRSDGASIANLLLRMANADDSPGEYESLLSEELTKLRKLEFRLKRFRDGDDGPNPSRELTRALRDFVQTKGVRFRLPFLTGHEFELVDDVLKGLGAVRPFVPAEVARRVGPVREDERKVLPRELAVEIIKDAWPNFNDLWNASIDDAIMAIERELARDPAGAGFRVPKKSTINKALIEARGGHVKPRGAGRSKKLRDQAGAKRRNRKQFG